MKLKINKIQNVWIVKFEGDIINTKAFEHHEAAIEYANKLWKRFYKESTAFSIINQLSINLLSIDEKDFVDKLVETQCKNITPKQYGYLRGIYERQEREW